MEQQTLIEQAAQLIRQAQHLTAFTGAGISVESGVPPFRGPGGIWNQYDPSLLDLHRFLTQPEKSWPVIRKLFFDHTTNAQTNRAHTALAELEQMGHLQQIITQNIDNLHQKAGSRAIYEFHGNTRYLVCTRCRKQHVVEHIDPLSPSDHPDADINEIPFPRCLSCGALLKPEFVFFGEGIPEPAQSGSFREAETADLFLLIGTSGEVYPAAQIPLLAKQNGARLIEINIAPSAYTHRVNIFLQGKASEVMDLLLSHVHRLS